MPKLVDHDEYRRELLAGCFELFSRRGYDNVTMREIAAELNVSTGTLYHYFPTKQAVFEQLFEQERVLDIAEILTQVGDLPDREAVIRGVFEHWDQKKSYYQNIMLLAVDYFRGNGAVPDQGPLADFSAYYREAIGANFGVKPAMASFIFVFIIGLMYHSLLVPGSVNFTEQLALLKECIMRKKVPAGKK